MEKGKKFYNEVEALYKGIAYIVRLLGWGYRCGYVEVPKSIFKRFENRKGELLCHGGITFYRYVGHNDKIQLPEGYWIGFDCNHYEDGIDKEAVKLLLGNTKYLLEGDYLKSFKAVTMEEVERDCKKLIDQLFD